MYRLIKKLENINNMNLNDDTKILYHVIARDENTKSFRPDSIQMIVGEDKSLTIVSGYGGVMKLSKHEFEHLIAVARG